MNKKTIFDRIEVKCPKCEYEGVSRNPLDDSASHYCFGCDIAFTPRITELTEESFEMLHLVVKQIIDARFAANEDMSELTWKAAMVYLNAVEKEYTGTIDSE